MIILDPATHTYRFKGKIVPGAGEILAANGLGRVSFSNDQAMRRGSLVHLACQLLDENRLDWGTIDPRLLNYVKAYEKAKAEIKFVPRLIETPLYCPTWNFAGTPDRIAEYNGNLILIDIKTGGMLPIYRLKMGGYTLLAEASLFKIGQSLILCLQEDASYKTHWISGTQETHDFITILSFQNVMNKYRG